MIWRKTLGFLFGFVLLALVGGCNQVESTVLAEVPTPATTPGPGSAQKLPKLVDVGADKCIPCVMMAPILEELTTEYAGQFEVEFVDVWKYREKAATYGVRMIPTQIFYDASGKELFRRSGFIGKDDILAKWRDLGYDFESPRPR